jgi:hypothetical protein
MSKVRWVSEYLAEANWRAIHLCDLKGNTIETYDITQVYIRRLEVPRLIRVMRQLILVHPALEEGPAADP